MGNCLQSLFRSQRSSLRQQSLLNYQQLSTIIKPSTQNDSYFYLCHNMSEVQKFLSRFSSGPSNSVDAANIHKNIDILTKFVLQLRDRSSQVGKQIYQQQQRLKTYIKSQQNQTGFSQNAIRSNTVILKLEVQVLLLPVNVRQDLQIGKSWDLCIEIFQQEDLSAKKKNVKSSIDSSGKNFMAESMEFTKKDLIQRFIIDSSTKKTDNTNYSKSYQKKPKKKSLDQSPDKNTQNENDIQQYSICQYSSKIVKKTSMILIKLFKIKRKREISSISQVKRDVQNSNQISIQEKIDQNYKNKMLIGQTCLSVSDFIYYNSLIVSDVVPINPPTSIKSSITTASSSTSMAVAFISLRGQGLRAQTLDKDYMKIIKQHQIVIQQLQICLEGQKGWEKLSQFRNSNASQKGDSLYSDYSVPIDRAYKI